MERIAPMRKAPTNNHLGTLLAFAAFIVTPTIGRAQCPGANSPSESVWFNEQNTAFDSHLMETNTDEGSGLYDNMLSNLIVNTNWPGISSWENPVSYSSLNVDFAWTDTLQSGETCYADRSVSPNAISLTYKYRRFTLNGASGIAFFHSNFHGLCRIPPNGPYEAYGFIHNTGTCCDLHEDAFLADQKDDGMGNGDAGTFCAGEPVSGPKPPGVAVPALLRPWDPDDEKLMIFVELSGGPGPHSAMTRLQQTLLARKALVEGPMFHTSCYDVQKVFLTGGSFGSAVALAAQMIYPAQFDGTLAAGNAFVSTDAFFGYERFFSHAQSQIALNGKGLSGGASRISTSDRWTYDQFQRMLKAKNTTGGTFGFNNMSFFDRLAHRISNSSDPALTDPVIIVNGDEDSIAQGSHFRLEFENLISTNNLPNSGPAYTSLIKVITVPFRDHGNPAGESETIQLHPDLFTDDNVQPSSSSSTVDWLIYLAENPPSGLTDPSTPPPFDEGVPEPNSASDYRFENFLFTAPPDEDDSSNLLSHVWTIGTGSAPGLNDNMIVANVDTDEYLEVVYGNNDGFVHIYEWKNDKLEFQWKSPDMGHGVGAIAVGDFTAQAGGTEKGILALSSSGEVWAIRTEPSQPDATRLPQAELLIAGERDLPVIAIGEHTGTTTPVYIVGTSPPNGTPVGDYPNESVITRVNVDNIYNFSPTTVTIIDQEPCEPFTQIQWDADNEELLGTTARGYLYRIKYDSSGGDFKFLSTIDNFGLGEYVGMTLRQCQKVDLDGEEVYFVVGHSETDPTGSVGDKRNLAALSACGTLLSFEQVTKGLNPDASFHDLFCLEVIAIGTDTVRLALGGIDGVRFFDFNYDSTTPTNSSFSEVVFSGTSTPSYWSARRWLDNSSNEQFIDETVISLEYFQDESQSTTRDHLVGTTERGIVFIWELPGGFTNPPTTPTIEDLISPYNGAFGMKVISHAMNEFEPYSSQGGQPFTCPIDEALTLNLLPRFSYDHTLPALNDQVASRSFFEKVDVSDGSSLCRRARSDVGQALTPDLRLPPLFQAPNPVDFDGQLLYDLFFLDTEEPDLEIHYFLETMDVGETATSGTFDAAYTQSNMDGQLKLRSNYLTGSSISTFPGSGTYLLTDRYYVNSELYRGGIFNPSVFSAAYFGNAIRMGDVTGAETSTPQPDDVVMTTIGGRVVVVSGGTPSLSWGSSPPYSTDGDFGFHMTGLALYDVDGDGLDEIFAVAGTNSDPNDYDNINSHLLIWDTTSSLDLSSPDQRIDLSDIGCFGLWVGPAIGEDSDETSGPYDVIVGGSQTFSVYRIDTAQNEWIGTSSFESKGLGTNIGAFNSIRVHRDVSGTDIKDFVFVGSSAYYHAYSTETFTVSE